MQMNPYMLLALEALLYALLFGLLSWLRGEGLPGRFALEVVAVAVISLGLSWAARVAIHPIVFLLLIYVLTMRARLLVDLANAFAARRRYLQALALLDLAARLAADPIARTMVRINTAVVWIRQQRLDEAVGLLNEALGDLPKARGSPKYEAACRYNLGLSYLRLGQDGSAVGQFNQVIELLPNSLYARGAEAALRERRRANKEP